VATSPKVAGVTGKYFNPIGIESKPSANAQDAKLAAQLWEHSMQTLQNKGFISKL
jgi:hypothetical protein